MKNKTMHQATVYKTVQISSTSTSYNQKEMLIALKIHSENTAVQYTIVKHSLLNIMSMLRDFFFSPTLIFSMQDFL